MRLGCIVMNGALAISCEVPLLANDIIFFEATCNIGWKVYGSTYNDHRNFLLDLGDGPVSGDVSVGI